MLDNAHKLIRRGASRILRDFARRRSVAQPLDGEAWDIFSRIHEFSSEERSRRCMYALIAGHETQHQLDLLTRL